MMTIIPQTLEQLDGGGQGTPTIVDAVIFDVLQKQHVGLVKLRNSEDVVEKRAASILETSLLAGDTERLARKACAQDVMRRNCARFDFSKITARRFSKIKGIRLLGMRVVIGGKDAGMAQFLQGKAKTTYAAKQVDETKTRHLPDHLR
tara:strand:- start:1140 stop:1583 length:444 start_codon:yes stop_codon:yes gene_type:complete